MTPKDQFRYSVLSAIHDEARSISDAIDQAYGEHVAGKDAEIERLRDRSTKFEQLLSEALRGCLKSPDSVQFGDYTRSFQLPNPWAESYARTLSVEISGLFKHPLTIPTRLV